MLNTVLPVVDDIIRINSVNNMLMLAEVCMTIAPKNIFISETRVRLQLESLGDNDTVSSLSLHFMLIFLVNNVNNVNKLKEMIQKELYKP